MISAIFNHAVKFYDLPNNPAQKAGNMDKEKSREMLFWTQEEYKAFAEAVMDKPISFYAFEVLDWGGLRLCIVSSRYVYLCTASLLPLSFDILRHILCTLSFSSPMSIILHHMAKNNPI